MWSAPATGRSCGSTVSQSSGLPEAGAQPAAGVEPAPGRRIGRRGHVALEDEPLLADPSGRGWARPTGARRCRGGGAARRARRRRPARRPAEVHHPDPVADVLDDREVVGDEQVGQAELLLEVVEQVQDLALDRHVERRDRLVADDELGVQGERPGDADALALAAARTRAGSGGCGSGRGRPCRAAPRTRSSRLVLSVRPWTSGPRRRSRRPSSAG